MKKSFKGQAGYFKYKKTTLGLISLIGFLLMFGIYLAGYLFWGTGKNYLTILAVLVILPTAKFFVQYLMIPWKGYVTLDDYEEMNSKCGTLKLYSELMITAQEKRFQISYLLIDKEENIIAYTPDIKTDAQAFEKGVTNFLNYYNFNSKVKLYNDLKSFEKKCVNLASRNKEITQEEFEHTELIFEKISIMSI